VAVYVLKQEKDVLKQKKDVLKQEKDVQKLEKDVLKQEKEVLKQEIWSFFLKNVSAFCPGTEEFVPGFLLLPLSRDKGTTGQENFFVLGQRDNGTSRPVETLVWMIILKFKSETDSNLQ
jgi:hypothetical protein